MKYAYFIVGLIILISAGFDKDNAHFEDLNSAQTIDEITTDQFYAAMPSGYSFLTASGCPIGWVTHFSGYVKLSTTPSTVPAGGDLSWQPHYHTSSGLDFLITEDSATILSDLAHTHRMRHIHAFTYKGAGAYDIEADLGVTSAADAYSQTNTQNVQIWQASTNITTPDNTSPDHFIALPDLAVTVGDRYSFLPVSCNSSDLFAEQYTDDSNQLPNSTSHYHRTKAEVGQKEEFKSPAKIGNVTGADGDSIQAVIGDFSKVTLKLCEKP